MTLIRSAYRGYTATAIKSRADVPTQGSMTIDGTNVNCNNIDMDYVNAAIGTSGVNDLGNLCTHGNINRWSAYSPIVRTISSQLLINSVPSGTYNLEEFAGYNHQAVAPGWITSAPSGNIWVNAGSSPEFLTDVYVGEVKWHELGIVGITLAMYYPEGGLYAWGSVNFNTSSVQDSVTSLTAVGAPTIERTYTGKLWLVDNTAEFDGSQIVCRLPNTADFTQTVKIKAASTWYYGSSGTQSPPSPWGVYGGIGMNWSTGYFTIGQLMANASYTNIKVTAYLFNWLDQLIGSYTFWNTAYYPMDEITGSGYLGMANIPSYGYKVRVDIEESY